MKATVEQDGCISCGLCINVCPEVFSYNENDISEAIKGDIPSDVVDKAEEAKDACPVSVIELYD